MDNVITLSFGRTYTDGGKSRIRMRREHRLVAAAKHAVAIARDPDSLAMRCADPEQPYEAPVDDCA